MRRSSPLTAIRDLFNQHENDILIACALRFDGYPYIEAQKFDHQRALAAFFETGTWPTEPLEQLTIFFMLQRGLFKWGLEREPKYGRYWHAFRTLFLITHSYEIPDSFRMYERYEEWEREYRPNLAEHVAFIKRIHAMTPYDDNAKPTL